MALPPLGAPPPSLSTQQPGFGGKSALTSAEERARQTESEANRRIVSAEREIEDARKTADLRIDSIQDQFEKQETTETDRNLERLEKQRMKGYEQVRDLQRAQQADLARTRREGERELAKLQEFYRDAIHSNERQSTDKLKSLENQHTREIEVTARSRQDELSVAKDSSRRQSEELRTESEQKINDLREASTKEYERVRQNTFRADEEMRTHFQHQFDEKTANSQDTLNDIDARASRTIGEIRRDTAHKLAAYADRQDDPFYKLLDLDISLHDRGDFYELKATIPQHEQEHVSVTVKGSQIVISGARRNEEKLEIEPGRTKGTNSFQSYLETFPLTWPVDTKRLSREFEGDQLTVRLPKKGDYAHEPPKGTQATPERARLQRPKFPDNLPLAKIEAARESPQDPTVTLSSRPKPRGGKTLT